MPCSDRAFESALIVAAVLIFSGVGFVLMHFVVKFW